jgi:hypothetical protein
VSLPKISTVATGCCYRRWDMVKAALTIYKSTFKGPARHPQLEVFR